VAIEVPQPDPHSGRVFTTVGAVSLRLYFPEMLLSEIPVIPPIPTFDQFFRSSMSQSISDNNNFLVSPDVSNYLLKSSGSGL
jgi:hypothetical protein